MKIDLPYLQEKFESYVSGEIIHFPPNYVLPDFSSNIDVNLSLSKRGEKYGTWWRYLQIFQLFTEEEVGKSLDLGSGWGTVYYFMNLLGYDSRAIDIANPSSIPHSDFLEYNLDENSTLPFEDNSFEVVVCSEVIEHLEKPFIILEEIHRILKPEASLILTIPNILSLRSRLSFFLTGKHTGFSWKVDKDGKVYPKGGVGGHVSPIDYFALLHFSQKLGFEMVAKCTDFLIYPAGFKALPYLFLDSISKVFQGTEYSKVLNMGHSLIIKLRKK